MSASIASPEWLRDHLADVVLLDARTGPGARDAYENAHLPGARFVDLETDLAAPHDPRDGGRHPLPPPERFAATLGRLGIRPSDTIVVYDLASGANAASRAWWMLRAVGHADVRVLEGNPATFETSGLAMTTEPSTFESTEPYPATAYTWPTVDVARVDAMRDDGACVVVDARSGPRFRGEVEPIDPVAGRIPGAQNVFHMDLVDANGRMRPPDEIRARLAAVVGERDAEHVAVHCGSGVTACHLILAMEHAGLRVPSLYVGSFGEWCRQDRPLAKGEPGSERA